MSEEAVARLEARIAELEARQLELEDDRAIRELLALYGFYADMGKHELFVGLFSEDGVMNLIGGVPSDGNEGQARWEGRERLREFMDDPKMHMKIEGRCMHLPELSLRTSVRGEDAEAETCSLVLVEEGGSLHLYGAGFTRWLLHKTDRRWHIKERIRVAIGADYESTFFQP